MKRLIGLLLVIWVSGNAFSQKMPSDYFDEGFDYLENEEPQKALESFQYIVDNHPKNELYPRAFYNLGYIYYQEKEYDKSIKLFKTILTGNFNETEVLGGDIMADPYANYRHRASLLLYNIYFQTEQYDSSLYYLGQSDSVYKYMHFCGNAYAQQGISQAMQYAALYEKMDEVDKAIQILLPHVFVSLADNKGLLEDLKKLLHQEPHYYRLEKDLERALYRMKSVHETNGEYEYTRYYFTFKKVEIRIPSNFIDDDFNKTATVNKIKQTNFYKMVKSL